MVPVNTNLSLLAEVRSRYGIEAAACGVGVLLCTCDTSIPTGLGPIRVIDSTPGSGGCDPEIGEERNDAPFELNAKYSSATLGIDVTIVDKAGHDYFIRVDKY